MRSYFHPILKTTFYNGRSKHSQNILWIFFLKRMVKKTNLKQFTHLKTPQMSERIWNRRETHAGSLREKLESNICMIKKRFDKMKKIPLLKFLSICRTIVFMVKGKKKSDIPDKNLFSSTKKVRISAAISCYGVTKLFFVNNNGIKVNKENYCRHLRYFLL